MAFRRAKTSAYLSASRQRLHRLSELAGRAAAGAVSGHCGDPVPSSLFVREEGYFFMCQRVAERLAYVAQSLRD